MNPYLQQVLHDITARIEALEEAKNEPAEWMKPDALCDKNCLYACTKGFTQFPECATKREWVGLTDAEIAGFAKTMERGNFLVAIYDIEKKLKEKNT